MNGKEVMEAIDQASKMARQGDSFTKKEGLRLLEKMVEDGISQAALSLMWIYGLGLNNSHWYQVFLDFFTSNSTTDSDDKNYLKFLSKAAELRNPVALVKCAKADYDLKNYRETYFYASMAVDNPEYFHDSSVRSMSYISSIYAYGLGVEKRLDHACLVHFIQEIWRVDFPRPIGEQPEDQYKFSPLDFNLPPLVIEFAKEAARIYFDMCKNNDERIKIAQPIADFERYYETFNNMISEENTVHERNASNTSNQIENYSEITSSSNDDEIEKNQIVMFLKDWTIVELLHKNEVNVPIRTSTERFPDYISYFQRKRELLKIYSGVVKGTHVKAHCFEDCIVGQLHADSPNAIGIILSPVFAEMDNTDETKHLAELYRINKVLAAMKFFNQVEKDEFGEDVTIENTILSDLYNMILLIDELR